jgi:hypothetical protein
MPVKSGGHWRAILPDFGKPYPMTFKLCLAEPLVVLVERATYTSVTGKTVTHWPVTWFTYVVLPQRA